jgi:hypothetical protein
MYTASIVTTENKTLVRMMAEKEQETNQLAVICDMQLAKRPE